VYLPDINPIPFLLLELTATLHKLSLVRLLFAVVNCAKNDTFKYLLRFFKPDPVFRKARLAFSSIPFKIHFITL